MFEKFVFESLTMFTEIPGHPTCRYTGTPASPLQSSWACVDIVAMASLNCITGLSMRKEARIHLTEGEPAQ
eukprot:1311104-Amphidinium_carterae.2